MLDFNLFSIQLQIRLNDELLFPHWVGTITDS